MFWRLRRLIRERFQPIDVATARASKEKLSIIYALVAWNAFGYGCYLMLKSAAPQTHDVTDYAKMLGVKNATVIKYKGFNKTDQFEVNYTDDEIEEFYGAESSKESESKVEETSSELKSKVIE